MSLDTVTMLRHGKVELALHHLRDSTAGGGRPLLVLHGLGEAAPRSAPRWTDGWPGPHPPRSLDHVLSVCSCRASVMAAWSA